MKILLLVFCFFSIASCNQQTINYKEISKRTLASKDIIKEFGGELKEQLQSAMKSGGPIAAMTVCYEQAPIIANKLSERTGWDIHRTSLKPRHTKPDAWETSIMQSFEQRQADGDKFKSLFNQDISEVNGQASFRYMQAIETQHVCLVCHGENVAPEIAQKIKKLYPNDTATGFKLGDIRGAFSIVQPLTD